MKKRYWAFVLYPESAPSDWRDILQQTGIGFVISPFHDKDINPTGEQKKPHYHIILGYDGPTTFNNVKHNITDKLCQPIPIPLESPKGYYRYLTHKDNPEKYQYDESEILVFNGFDISDFNSLTDSEVDAILFEVTDLIVEHRIVEYSVLMDMLKTLNLLDAWKVARKNTLFLNTYLTSRRNMLKEKNER